MLLLIICVVITMAEVSSALSILQLDKSRSWLSWLGIGNYELTILVFMLVLMPSAMVHVVAFGVITTTLDMLLAGHLWWTSWLFVLLSFNDLSLVGDVKSDFYVLLLLL